MLKIVPGSLGASISHRLSLATRFAREMLEQQKRDDEISWALLMHAPTTEIRSWISEGNIIPNLFEFGRANSKIVFDEGPFGGIEDVKAVMEKLQGAWEGLVAIKLDDNPEIHHVEVVFTAVMK